jgi:hypothetical protein
LPGASERVDLEDYWLQDEVDFNQWAVIVRCTALPDLMFVVYIQSVGGVLGLLLVLLLLQGRELYEAGLVPLTLDDDLVSVVHDRVLHFHI